LEAALAGAREIGFTVVSISISLIAVPLLLMGGIIGRLFREFALTVTASIVVSACVSLTLAPMMAARFMRRPSHEHGRVYLAFEVFFDTLLHGYRRTLNIALAHQRITLAVFFATLGLTVVMFLVIPKGFFPNQDTGLIFALTEAAQDVSPAEMMRLQEELGAIVAGGDGPAGLLGDAAGAPVKRAESSTYQARPRAPFARGRGRADRLGGSRCRARSGRRAPRFEDDHAGAYANQERPPGLFRRDGSRAAADAKPGANLRTGSASGLQSYENS
jgi:hypothetical protein